MKNIRLILLGVSALSSVATAVLADVPPVIPAPPVTWIAPAEETQRVLFAYLKERAGEEVAAPVYTANDLQGWLGEQSKRKLEGKALYKNIAEHLLIARGLLDEAERAKTAEAREAAQRRAMLVAENAAFRASFEAKDRWASARIREGFQLPFLQAAPIEGWEQLGRPRIVEDVIVDYREGGEVERHIAALKYLTSVASSRNSADAARWGLARIYAERGDYERAIAYLEVVRDPSISAMKKYIPEYQQKLAEQQAKAQATK